MGSQETKAKICEAAMRLAGREGLSALTLDGVAKEAGMTKGGVMYHFPSKEELVTGVIHFFGERLERELTRSVAEDPRPHGRWARAMIKLALPATASPSTEGEHDAMPAETVQRFLLATLAGAINNPNLLNPMRELGRQLQERLVRDDNGALDQLLVWLMVDGLFLWEFIGLIQRDDPLFGRIVETIRSRVGIDLKQGE